MKCFCYGGKRLTVTARTGPGRVIRGRRRDHRAPPRTHGECTSLPSCSYRRTQRHKHTDTHEHTRVCIAFLHCHPLSRTAWTSTSGIPCRKVLIKGRPAMSVKKLLRQVLDDLCTRFVINIPDDEIEDPIRVLFVLEQAHWYENAHTHSSHGRHAARHHSPNSAYGYSVGQRPSFARLGAFAR
jgi:hypothetical protein